MVHNLRPILLRVALFPIVLALQISTVSACSYGPGFNDFPVDKGAWEQSQKEIQSSGAVNIVDILPSPVVHVKNITRGIYSVGSSCGDAGRLVIEVSVPADSKYSLEELGVYFRLVEGETPDKIFYDLPLTGFIKENHSTYTFRWLDGHPSRQKSIDVTVEAFFVSKNIEFGPQTEFVVQSKVKKSKPAHQDR